MGRVERILNRVLCYAWASPTTLLGMLFLPVALLGGGKARWVDGVLEIHGPAIAWFLRTCTVLKGGASAMTLGHVVLGRDAFLLEATRPHERVHVKQCERWGPLFVPAYLVMALVLWARGRDPYDDNPFEREAFEGEGGDL